MLDGKGLSVGGEAREGVCEWGGVWRVLAAGAGEAVRIVGSSSKECWRFNWMDEL